MGGSQAGPLTAILHARLCRGRTADIRTSRAWKDNRPACRRTLYIRGITGGRAPPQLPWNGASSNDTTSHLDRDFRWRAISAGTLCAKTDRWPENGVAGAKGTPQSECHLGAAVDGTSIDGGVGRRPRRCWSRRARCSQGACGRDPKPVRHRAGLSCPRTGRPAVPNPSAAGRWLQISAANFTGFRADRPAAGQRRKEHKKKKEEKETASRSPPGVTTGRGHSSWPRVGI